MVLQFPLLSGSLASHSTPQDG